MHQLLTSPSTSAPRRPFSRRRSIVAQTGIEEIRVCTNKTCRRQGSFQTLQNLTDLSPPNVIVKASGCLGSCGSGPNVAVLPQGTIVSHCGTASHAVHLVCNPKDGSLRKNLDALSLRRSAEAELECCDFAKAEHLLSQAIDLNPHCGIHNLLRLRSSTRLSLNDKTGALEDARKALELFPQHVEARICEGDALMAMEQYDAAENSYAICLQIDPSIRRSKSFKAKISRLNEKLVNVTSSS